MPDDIDQDLPRLEHPKDFWDKFSIVVKPAWASLTAACVGALGYMASTLVETARESDARIQLYSELMSKREEAETDLRKAMFSSVVESFLKPEPTSDKVEARLVSLELLAYNFHESFELKPLFLHLRRQMAGSRDPGSGQRLRRLEQLARDVSARQMRVLEEAGAAFRRTVNLDSLRTSIREGKGGLELEAQTLTLDRVKRNFQVIVDEEDRNARELRVRLAVLTDGERLDTQPFAVGFFDFPMIDNTRLSHDQRCALVVNALDDHSADVSVIYFPGTRASLRDRPYYEDVVHSLVDSAVNHRE